MSTYYQAIVGMADSTQLQTSLKTLPDKYARLTLELFHPQKRGFVFFLSLNGAYRPNPEMQAEGLASELSNVFGSAISIRYDDQCGIREATLFKGRQAVRVYGETDEIWVPLDENGFVVLNGEQFPGDAIPNDIECDCIKNAIDAAFQDAGFQEWMTSRELIAISNRTDCDWRRDPPEIV